SIHGIAHADGVIDPHSILKQVDEFLGQPSFETSFVTGDSWAVTQHDCMGSGSTVTCDDAFSTISVKTKPAGTSSEPTAELTSYASDGHAFAVDDVVRSNWQSHFGNALRMYIDATTSYGLVVTLESAKPSSFPVLM